MANDWSKVDVTYDYVDENGALLYQVGRWNNPKAFSQRMSNGNGGWVYSLKDLERRVPFMLPELLNAIKRKETIYIPEGEKDALNLYELGVFATTSAQGAQTPWPEYWADFFVGAEKVVIIADNDEPGLEAAQHRAGIVARVCKDVRVISKLPGITEEGGDVSDWLAKGGTKEQLEALAAQAPLAEPSAPQPELPKGVRKANKLQAEWGALFRQIVDDGVLDSYLKFAGAWRANGTRSVQCPFPGHKNESDKPSGYLMTVKGSGLGCHHPEHKRNVLPLLVDLGWANTTDDARRKLRDLKYDVPVSRALQVVRAHTVTPRKIEWLWPGRIPYNNLTLLSGDGGIGKSFVTLAIAGAVTNGTKLPCDDGWQSVDQGEVLYVNFEDGEGRGIEEIVVPRAIKCDVNRERLHIISGARDEKGKLRPFSREFVGELSDYLDVHPNIRLIVIDPLMSFIGKADVFRDNEVREALSDIVHVVTHNKNKVALVIVHHNRKANGEKGVDKVSGSVGLVNMSRSVIAASFEMTVDEETGQIEAGRKMLTVIKGNHAGPTSPVPFRIDDEGKLWLENADTQLKGKDPGMAPKIQAGQKKGNQHSKIDQAIMLLEEMLSPREQWHDAWRIKEAARAKYISEDTLGNARKKLNVQVRIDQKIAQWWLPADNAF